MYSKGAVLLASAVQLIRKAHWTQLNSELRVHVTLWCPVYYRQAVLLFGRDFDDHFFISILCGLQEKTNKETD